MPENGRARRVVQLVQGLEFGGLECMAVDLATHLPDRYETRFLCYDTLGPLAQRLEACGVPFDCLERRPGLDLGLVRRIAHALRSFRPDVLHVHNHTAFFYGVLATRLARVPRVVYTEHGPPRELSLRVRRLERWLLRWVDEVVAVSPSLVEWMSADRGFPAARIRTVPNGVPSLSAPGERAGRELREECGFPPEARLIGAVGRLEPVKNHALLLEAFPRIVVQEPAARLVIVGEGSLGGALRARARELGLGERVCWLGDRADARVITAQLDAYVSCSDFEGTSIALIEAMSAARPIVASDVGGNAELLRGGAAGLLFPAGEADALAAALVRVLSDRELTRRLRAAARSVYTESYEVGVMIDTYRRLFDG